MANGLYTNSELMDSIIIDLNNSIKDVISGQYIHACVMVSGISQKLVNLRKTIDDDLKSKDKKIEDLKLALREAGHEVIEVSEEQLASTEEKEGGGSGGNNT